MSLHLRLELAIAFMALLYFAGVIGLVTLYNETRCPGGVLSLCQLKFSGTCGDPSLPGELGCSAFVGVEDCYCDKCRFCLAQSQREHCAKSASTRVAECASAFDAQEEKVVE